MATAPKTKKPAAAGAARKGRPPTPKGGGEKSCGVQACKRAYRAKGYCFFHYKKWRRGELPHSRYDACSNAECVKPVTKHGLCETHLKIWQASRKGALAAKKAEATPAAPPAAAPAA